MIKEPKRIYNVIISIILGFLFAQIIMFEGFVILMDKQQKEGIEYYGVVGDGSGVVIYKLVAFIVFLATVIIFNTRKPKRINLNKLSIYLILVVIISVIVPIEAVVGLSAVIVKTFPDFIDYIQNNYFMMVNFVCISIGLVIALFLMTFILLVNRKVKYIKFLTKEVKVIENEGFGKTIEVRGGDELAELCKSINSMSVELGKKIENEKRIENNKNELITNISHDLKTPLTSIVGYLEVLHSNELDDDTRSEYIKIAYNKSLRLKSLVNELFEYTKLTGSDIALKKYKVNIAMLINQAVGESIVNFIDKDINVVLDNPYNQIYCDIDAVQMLRVFENLIRNAEKYGDKNSEFRVSVNVSNKKIAISFINRCANITNDELEQFFEKFYRVDKSRREEGSGLGLAIVKRIVELHDGLITVEKIDDNIKFNILLNEA